MKKKKTEQAKRNEKERKWESIPWKEDKLVKMTNTQKTYNTDRSKIKNLNESVEKEAETEEEETTETTDKKPEPKKQDKKPEPSEKEKKDSRTEKIKALVAAKIEAITRDMDNADTIEEQMVIQAQLLALIAFVPDFDYDEMEVPDIYFYPPKPTVDHAFSRWFVNDPTFGVMEDLQYPNLR